MENSSKLKDTKKRQYWETVGWEKRRILRDLHQPRLADHHRHCVAYVRTTRPTDSAKTYGTAHPDSHTYTTDRMRWTMDDGQWDWMPLTLFVSALSSMKFLVSILLVTVASIAAFSIPQPSVAVSTKTPRTAAFLTICHARLSDQRKKDLGVGDDEDEYDLGVALENSTDPLISKIIAGSFILVVIALLVVGVVIPSLTDYGEGVCNPLLTGGRCY